MGEPVGDKDHFRQIHLGAGFPSLWIKVSLPVLVQERGEIYATFTKGNACSVFREIRGGQRSLPTFVYC